MGFRRLRARLDSLQGEASQTMALIQDLTADLADGFGVTVHLDANAVQKLIAILSGKAGDLPLTIKVDPRVDTKPK